MNTIVVIPARMASSRFPGKPLKKILGRSMIEHVWRRACLCSRVNRVVIATCDQLILDECKRIGAQGIMTSDKHSSCVDRVAEAAQKISADVIINLQGDIPLVHPQCLEELIKPFKDKEVLFTDMMGPIHNCAEENNLNVVKVVVDKKSNALYYSREPLPSGRKISTEVVVTRYKQFGINAYRQDSLKLFTSLAPTPLEKIESVDMLRLLENRYVVRMVNFDYPSVGVDTDEDLQHAEKLMQVDQFYKTYA
ncbi:MAG: 3-deoxy-manno-octulosonate cytidylyltransferase [Candidatus Omnitrophota bacterium]|nr:3-deoxy-manno-octulosonate cytidylyltransferase [Candidatus Omnitrophota bacterium]